MKSKGIKRLIASITEEFSTNLFETTVFLIALCVPILGLYLSVKLGFGYDAPPLKKTFVRATLILTALMAVISILFLLVVAIVGVVVVKQHFGW